MTIIVSAAGLSLLWMLSRNKDQPSGESFLVANRNVAFFSGVLILTANWVQAPALLVSGNLAYLSFAHFLALLLPNVAAMVLMGFIAVKLQRMMRERNEKWYTIAQAVGSIYGPGARTMVMLSTLGALIVAVTYTLTGIRQWLSQLTGVAPWEMSMIIGAAALILVAPTGLPAAIKADKFKVALIAAFAIMVALIMMGHGLKPQGPPFAGSPMSAWQVFWFVGVPLGISLMGGPICNPDLAERAYAVNERVVRNAYIGGGILFGVAATVFGSFGFLARELGYKVNLGAGELPMLVIIKEVLPSWSVLVVSAAIVAILAAALASLLASAGDVFSIEVMKRFFKPTAGDRDTVNWSRFAMLLPVIAGTYITSFERIDVRFLQETLAVVRGQAIFPVVFLAFLPFISGRAIFTGMLVGGVGGILLFLGWFSMDPALSKAFPFIAGLGKPLGAIPWIAMHGKAAGALFAVVASGLIPLLSLALSPPSPVREADAGSNRSPS